VVAKAASSIPIVGEMTRFVATLLLESKLSHIEKKQEIMLHLKLKLVYDTPVP
jgi:predicted translin family RNA/ssDNA-binding protein